jgi:hypothetical protein
MIEFHLDQHAGGAPYFQLVQQVAERLCVRSAEREQQWMEVLQ